MTEMSDNLKIYAVNYIRFGHIDFVGCIIEDAPAPTQIVQSIRFWFQRIRERRSAKRRIFIFSELGPRRGVPQYPWKFMHTRVVDLIHLCRVLVRRSTLILVRWSNSTVVTIDDGDHMGVAPADRYQLKVSLLYFKREGFVNPWMNLVTSDGSRSRSGTYLLHEWSREPSMRLVEKMRTLSLGVRVSDTIAEIDFSKKSIDVFLAAKSRSLPSRTSATNIARFLENKGYRVFVTDDRLSYASYLDTIRNSWIVLSPSGNGWDCYRHYETAANGALPVMDFPYIRGHRMFTHGKNCLYLGPEETGEAIEAILEEKVLLRNMIISAHAHAHANHTDHALGQYVTREICTLVDSRQQSVAFPSR